MVCIFRNGIDLCYKRTLLSGVVDRLCAADHIITANFISARMFCTTSRTTKILIRQQLSLYSSVKRPVLFSRTRKRRVTGNPSCRALLFVPPFSAPHFPQNIFLVG